MFFPGLRELPAAPRRFLYFSTINVISWQCLVGQPLVLFGRALDMPPGWVGYTNLWIIATSLAGLLIDWLGLTGFRLCFLASGLGGLLAATSLFRTSP